MSSCLHVELGLSTALQNPLYYSIHSRSSGDVLANKTLVDQFHEIDLLFWVTRIVDWYFYHVITGVSVSWCIVTRVVYVLYVLFVLDHSTFKGNHGYLVEVNLAVFRDSLIHQHLRLYGFIM